MSDRPVRRGGRPKKNNPVEATLIDSLAREFQIAVQLLRDGKDDEAREVATFSDYVWRRLGWANEGGRGRPLDSKEWLALALYLDEQGVEHGEVIKRVVVAYGEKLGAKVEFDREFERDVARRRKRDQAFRIAREVTVGKKKLRRPDDL